MTSASLSCLSGHCAVIALLVDSWVGIFPPRFSSAARSAGSEAGFPCPVVAVAALGCAGFLSYLLWIFLVLASPVSLLISQLASVLAIRGCQLAFSGKTASSFLSHLVAGAVVFALGYQSLTWYQTALSRSLCVCFWFLAKNRLSLRISTKLYLAAYDPCMGLFVGLGP